MIKEKTEMKPTRCALQELQKGEELNDVGN
jgi:uncharacterized protein YjiS (DUF1127 family)